MRHRPTDLDERILRRQRGVIILTVLVVTICTGLIAINLTPRYTASSTIVVEPRETHVIGLPPLAVTGGFGEYRQGHFHAGFDFGTGKKVGQPVFAPLAGHVERIRALGVDHVTITINMVDPEVGARIYPWIFFRHKRYTGIEAAQIPKVD